LKNVGNQCKIRENNGKHGKNTGKASSSHLLRILENGYNGPVGAAEADTDLSIFSSDPEAKGSRKQKPLKWDAVDYWEIRKCELKQLGII
jgi:hypothetical protein